MNIRPTRTFMRYLCFIGISLLINLSCSKDNDVFLDAVLDKEDDLVVEDNLDGIEEDEQEEVEDNDSNNEEMEDFESRITMFPAINDAYVQNGQGFDNSLIRLQENFRRSYLMFDLAPIDSVNGEITAANLKFIINMDDGNGMIKVFLSGSNDWSENNISDKTAPKAENQIGEITQTYKIGDEVEIELNISELPKGLNTLILEHENGNDLAFASKESTVKSGPKLQVTYEVPVSSEEIVVDDNQFIEGSEDEDNDENTGGDDTSGGDNTEDETTEDETNTDQESNTAPTAIAEATPISGIAPLEVNFNASKSTDDKGIESYTWDFRDGDISSAANATHSFSEPGSYNVILTVTDAEGLSETDEIMITATEKENEAPVAIATANRLTGEAPLTVNFMGSGSSDDEGIVSYQWDFQGGTSSEVNPSYTFTNAGSYTATLTVTDAEGLWSTSSLSLTVNPVTPSNPEADPIPCNAGSSRANISGEKVWCWNNLATEINAAGPLASFSSGQLAKSVHYNGQGVRATNGRLHFSLNPNSPDSGNGNNYRTEIRENPSNVDHALGTEQWFGWDYKFENDYKADALNEWIMWQVHGSFSSPAAPLISLWAAKQNMARQTNEPGEIFVVNAAVNTNNAEYVPTGIVPQAGQTLKIVVHVVWGDDNIGLYEVWINGTKIYSAQERTVYVEQPKGGYAKWGIYKWKWRSNSNVSASANQGITELNTSMGTLRSVMRRPGDADYGRDAYALVAPE